MEQGRGSHMAKRKIPPIPQNQDERLKVLRKIPPIPQNQDERLKVFISWSGERSKAVAEALKEWLPVIFQDLDAWVSSHDIKAGERWESEIGGQLETTDLGILCLTGDNLTAPWLLFEAGSLAKSVDKS